MPRTGLDPSVADLLQSAVHNLKGPASRLRLSAQLLSRHGEALNEDARSLLKYMEDSAAEVGVVAEGLSKYAELCARPVRRELVDLGLLAAAAVDNLQDEIANAGIQVTQAAMPSAPADRFLITWLFQELLANAIRFRSGSAPEVHISAAEGGPGNWYVAVSDNGPGIEPGLEHRVFLPFKKLSRAGGAGLGLTICRSIIDMHGGEIWIEPRDGGAEFRFFVSG
jgi:signal transduction histidine kinase